MRTTSSISSPDEFYDELLNAHSGLDAAQSADFNARLIFLLANQISGISVLRDCLAAAKLDSNYTRSGDKRTP